MNMHVYDEHTHAHLPMPGQRWMGICSSSSDHLHSHSHIPTYPVHHCTPHQTKSPPLHPHPEGSLIRTRVKALHAPPPRIHSECSEGPYENSPPIAARHTPHKASVRMLPGVLCMASRTLGKRGMMGQAGGHIGEGLAQGLLQNRF